jgi:uncharacterized membrane protein YqjE
MLSFHTLRWRAPSVDRSETIGAFFLAIVGLLCAAVYVIGLFALIGWIAGDDFAIENQWLNCCFFGVVLAPAWFLWAFGRFYGERIFNLLLDRLPRIIISANEPSLGRIEV